LYCRIVSSCIYLRVCEVRLLYMQMYGVQSCVIGQSVSFASASSSCETLRNLSRTWLWRLASWPLIAESGLEPGIVCFKICGGQSGTETSFSPSTSVSSCDCHYTNVSLSLSQTHTRTHSSYLDKKTSRRSKGTFKQSRSILMFEINGQKVLPRFSHKTSTILCRLDSPSADWSRLRFVRVDALWSRSFLCWVQNSVDVHIAACIVIHLERCFLLAVLSVCCCVLLRDLSVYLNLP